MINSKLTIIHPDTFTKQGIVLPAHDSVHFPIPGRIVYPPGFLYLSCGIHAFAPRKKNREKGHRDYIQ
jgi:hypothetical protein